MSNWNHLSVLSEIIVKSFRSVVLCFFLRLLRQKSEVALQDCLRPGDLRGYEIVLQILVVEIEIDIGVNRYVYLLIQDFLNGL